jgi:hypothetical protein
VQAQDGGRAAAARRRKDRGRNPGLADLAYLQEELGELAEEEEDLAPVEPAMVRNLMFPGEAGKEVWKEMLKDSVIERRRT